MRALLLILLVPALLWLTQSVLLRAAGRPLRWRIHAADLPRSYKRLNRVATNATLGLVLLLYPLLRGTGILGYYAQFLPLDANSWEILAGFSAALLYLTLLYFVWMVTDNIRFEVRHRRAKIVRRLLAVPLTAILAAGIEELLFRGVLLADLLDTLPAIAAVPLGAFIFAAAHYVRSVKRYWTFPGHLALGLLLCTAFYLTGTLWLSMGIHAAGVLVLMAARPFIRYVGPPWLVGASIYPYAGVPGVVALLLLTLNLWLAGYHTA